MVAEMKLPEMGEGVESADVVSVLVKPGDQIKNEEPVLEVETEKATVEVPASLAGRVAEVRVKQGDKVSVGQVLLTVEEGDGQKTDATPQDVAREDSAKADGPVREAEPRAEEPAVAASAGKPEAATEPTAEQADRPISASPAVRKFAREIGVEIAKVHGTGPGGRISEEDVKQFARQGRAAGPVEADRPERGAAATPPLPDFARWGPVEREKLNNVRKASAAHVRMSWSAIPHVTVYEQADITDVERIRQQYKSSVEHAGGKLTVTAILVKVVAHALRAFPRVNASLDAHSQELILKKYYDLGVAVDTERGLVVPVIRGADGKNIQQLAVELVQVSARAREGKLSPDEMRGATFTITNLGSLGTGYFSPIVNWPEAAILGVGRAGPMPAAAPAGQSKIEQDPAFVSRLMLPLSLSFDHRIIDGADAARFLHWIVEALQRPLMLAMEG